MRVMYKVLLLLPCLVAATAARGGSVLFFGDSLTAGYGLRKEEAYPALLADKMNAGGFTQRVINAGVSGETTAAGLRRVDWAMREPVDVLVLALGANDGLRGVPVEETERNLQAIVDKVRAQNPKARVLFAGMQVPPNLGPTYAASFAEIFPRLARQNHASLIPFLLEGVGGKPELNQEDGIHPTAEGQRIVADTVWRHLKPLLAAP